MNYLSWVGESAIIKLNTLVVMWLAKGLSIFAVKKLNTTKTFMKLLADKHPWLGDHTVFVDHKSITFTFKKYIPMLNNASVLNLTSKKEESHSLHGSVMSERIFRFLILVSGLLNLLQRSLQDQLFQVCLLFCIRLNARLMPDTVMALSSLSDYCTKSNFRTCLV